MKAAWKGSKELHVAMAIVVDVSLISGQMMSVA